MPLPLPIPGGPIGDYSKIDLVVPLHAHPHTRIFCIVAEQGRRWAHVRSWSPPSPSAGGTSPPLPARSCCPRRLPWVVLPVQRPACDGSRARALRRLPWAEVPTVSSSAWRGGAAPGATRCSISAPSMARRTCERMTSETHMSFSTGLSWVAFLYSIAGDGSKIWVASK
jgi:hypothetical protein